MYSTVFASLYSAKYETEHARCMENPNGKSCAANIFHPFLPDFLYFCLGYIIITTTKKYHTHAVKIFHNNSRQHISYEYYWFFGRRVLHNPQNYFYYTGYSFFLFININTKNHTPTEYLCMGMIFCFFPLSGSRASSIQPQHKLRHL